MGWLFVKKNKFFVVLSSLFLTIGIVPIVLSCTNTNKDNAQVQKNEQNITKNYLHEETNNKTKEENQKEDFFEKIEKA